MCRQTCPVLVLGCSEYLSFIEGGRRLLILSRAVSAPKRSKRLRGLLLHICRDILVVSYQC